MIEDVAEDVASQDELGSLKDRAVLLGIQFHPSIGLEKLREKVNATVQGTTQPVDVPKPETESVSQQRQRFKKEALALVRIRLTCMNPAKSEWEGEIITAGNSLVGSIKKFIPFNADEGWHVPNIIYQQLKDRQCQVFVSSKDARGNSVRKGKLIKEFSIEVLPPLTTDELAERARRQAMAKSID